MNTRTHRALPTTIRIPSQLAFRAIHFDRTGYRVHLSEFGVANGETLEVDFGRNSIAQRSMDEGMYLDSSWELDLTGGPVGSIVLVDNSDFLEWFEKESLGVYSDRAIFHVSILTQEEWIEVICNRIPDIRWV